MKIGVTLGTILLFVLSTGSSFCQRQLTKEEILKTIKAFENPVNKDSLFGFEIHSQTRVTLDKLLTSGVDTLVVYSVSYPGYYQLKRDTCSTMYPVETYFFVRRTGKDFIKTVNGKCEVVQQETDDKVIKFTLENFSKLFEDFFMKVTFSAVLDNGKLRMSGGAIDHEPNYEILLQVSDKFKYFRFTDSELTNKSSLFYEHNQNLTSYKLFELIRTQIKKD
ncbi:MAG: hypothetical protein JSU09_15775 [Bacteroidetes bacterium]|nr:hypothetical protein [Bacteroidota bacterium]